MGLAEQAVAFAGRILRDPERWIAQERRISEMAVCAMNTA
jgi:hypothetical protein